MIRIFDRPLGQGLLALVCAAILILAGLSERRKRPPDDLPEPDAAAHQRGAGAVTEQRVRRRSGRGVPVSDQDTAERRVPRTPPGAGREPGLFDPESGAIDPLRSVHDAPTEPLPPPEFKVPPRKPPPPGDD
jgi:hypothetical protein